jgi:tight adherence protein C
MTAGLIALFTFVAALTVAGATWAAIAQVAASYEGGAETWWANATQRLARLAVPEDSQQLDAIQLDLVRAGYTDRNADLTFFAVRAGLGLGLPLLGFLLYRPTEIQWIVGLIAVPGTLGYLLPRGFLDRAIRLRQDAIRRGIPALVDLVMPALEAGLGVDAALRYAASELERSAPELAATVRRATTLVDAGIPRERALDEWLHRTGVEELEPLAHLLSRAERSGVGVSDALDSYAHQVREAALHETERTMAKVGPYLTIVAVVFVLPMTLVVLVAPAVMRLVELLSGGGG